MFHLLCSFVLCSLSCKCFIFVFYFFLISFVVLSASPFRSFFRVLSLFFLLLVAHWRALVLPHRYGIGLVLFKQERFAQAESHFRKALSIHPHSSVLMCHVAVVSMLQIGTVFLTLTTGTLILVCHTAVVVVVYAWVNYYAHVEDAPNFESVLTYEDVLLVVC